MRVQMLTKIGGYRNEVDWPEKGGFIVVPDHEGRDLIVAGYAKEAPDADEDEPAVDDGSEEAGAEPADEAASNADGEAVADEDQPAAADGDSEAGADGNPADAVTEPEKPAKVQRAAKAAK